MGKKSIRGTRTEQNLLKAFAGESQAWARYTMFAKKARKEGYEVIAKFFDETAANEQQHGKVFFKLLEGGMVEITASYPAGVIGTTAENLAEAAEGEHDEGHVLYPEFARIAEEEGFPEVAVKFRLITAVEKDHEARYRKLLKTLEAGEMFKKDTPQAWRCRKCGYVHKGTQAPDKCPICDHPQAYFEIMDDKF
ncbi:rubrerythrin [uncultured Rikenella sp.]|uniref:rubrerythrin n=1 Tax=uncultured Rikenella sp. TaxID=368003 RepID=UPI0025D1F31A|nr:rubrerythrin family protein [uncultured Rikenella sp.]